MESSKQQLTALLLISMFFISTATPIALDCVPCGGKGKPPHHSTNPPSGKPPVVTPPITLPPILNPPVLNPPSGGQPGTPCPPPPFVPVPAPTCPIDALKLGACVDLLGGLVHIGLGDPVVNQCCPVLAGLVELEAAVCLCTTLKIKLLNINIYLPLALQLLVTCGKTPPPGYTCSI
ncbi:Bifunctional inhibitor/plant lipid transfer protein/seed storage helical domain-containing protein [Artemisia annua]|uniref:Bifunctional inhibitor/plant lipid transfer protein/seed storage helical domain-containing protein n=1 Tax=Artemisia annua TaxID=35608 RepID=A0A2U1NZG4_ARTAN|nr:Bifunctional inhibitor/plant lipid transfer protein/seed storage helical domain-containing protein [Artemisia annua]